MRASKLDGQVALAGKTDPAWAEGKGRCARAHNKETPREEVGSSDREGKEGGEICR
jgi:hypothetical protein